MQMFENEKSAFIEALRREADKFYERITTHDGQWSIKGFVDVNRSVYSISGDTKVVSKILEIHLFPDILAFARRLNFRVELAQYQNYYPDLTFIKIGNDKLKFAVDLKTTYREPCKVDTCNGLTLGSHGEYFTNRESTKNIQYPYRQYAGHVCLGIIYTRAGAQQVDETKAFKLADLPKIASVIRDPQFFVQEKWRIASDKGGSGNTANIGSITRIPDILGGRGMFSRLGEAWFDDYWMNYRGITVTDLEGKTRRIINLKEFVAYRGGEVGEIVPKARAKRRAT